MANWQSLLDKEVINVRDGERLGYVCDVSVDVACGTIGEIIVPCCTTFVKFFKPKRRYYIRWCNVVRVGNDIILVDVCASDIIRTCEDKIC